ncbi:ADP-ribosyltransferase-containing protein [Albibacterium indicum]|uniref:ADP-ribosyltransferase-containing protein n=1 Tax=Albibacterium indicum TaxID=2292082 RepID=UPI000E48823D|nr:hypothetical protein [Pedobacter indicus]
MGNTGEVQQINKVVYHGTNAEFDQFDLTKRGTNTGYPNTIHGLFFTEKVENASLFGKRIIKAIIVIEKAIDLTIHGIFSKKNQAPVIWEILTGEVLSEEDALTQLDENISLGEIADLYDALYSEESHQMLREAGYDGIISSLGNDELEYVVFDIFQICQIY